MTRTSVLLLIAFIGGSNFVRAAEAPEAIDFFEKKIRPVLIEHCYSCHSADAAKNKNLRGGLYLDTREGVRKGGDNGVAVIAGKPKESLLIKALHYETTKMPPKAKLPPAVIADFEKWVTMGAPDPRAGSPLVAKRPIDINVGKQHWAFRPLSNPMPPQVKQAARVLTPVDRFIVAKLEEKALTLNAPLSAEKLIRRAYFDLTGLPPTPEEIDVFLKDYATKPQEAYAKVIDRLLDSPRFGERWARHWLDIVRFAESGGYEFDKDRPGAFYYRDFVIKAFNADMPFDEFLRLQLAGDRLKPTDFETVAATGFLVAGPYPGQTTAKTLEPIRYDHLDDMLSTFGTSMLGLSIGCVRCHEHKYDPIPQQDYYHLLACLSRTDSVDAKFSVEKEIPAYTKAKAAYDKEHAPLAAALEKFEKNELPGRLRRWHESQKSFSFSRAAIELKYLLDKAKAPLTPKELTAASKPYRVLDAEANRIYQAAEDHAKKEPKQNFLNVFAATSGRGGDVHYLIRGETDRKNGVAKPGFVQVLMTGVEQEKQWLAYQPTATKKDPVDPRIGLADWTTDSKNGAGHLVARVIVNRLWQHHFGKGIVRTPNDFGTQGDPPTHPELLDFLASELIRNGWKLKPIHRLMMTSAVYMQAGEVTEAGTRSDPNNLLWWRVPPRRIEAELVRDSLLAVSGTLDLTMYGPGSLDGNILRRSVYLTVKRSRLIPMLQIFDAPEPIQGIGERHTTTAATQSLALMNSPFVRQRAEKLAARVLPKSPAGLPQAIDSAYRIALGRLPSDMERERMIRFVESQTGSSAGSKALDGPLADCCQVLLCLNEFVYVD
ncbi:MAG: PSD1 and planctomycete cytochrome C domain-containing protein [Planctomycetes bacterium]|nr:PSD1 and planctomycete cytochrome C domain-containing protein [Planctomycetota bacterium]